MEKTSDSFTPFNNMRELLLAMPQERSVASLLELAVQKCTEDPSLALTRIWLPRPGDQCDTCKLREQCLDQTRCLHLVAESYGPDFQPEEELNDDYTRIPLGIGKVGRCAVTGEVADIVSREDDLDYSISKCWAEQFNVIGLAVLPLIFQGKVLGVCGFVALDEAETEGEGLFWGRFGGLNHECRCI